jgi:hypothetical protein
MACLSVDPRIVRLFRFGRQRLPLSGDEGLEGFAPPGSPVKISVKTIGLPAQL